MIKNVMFWLHCARIYTLPITVLSWLTAFIYALKHGGNIYFGILSLFGISLVHLATNLIDDYFDYKILETNDECRCKTKGFKCAYLKNNQASIDDLRNIIIIFLAIASIIGLFLFIMTGKYVALLAIIGLVIALTYPKLSQNGFGEIAVIIAYGPLLFEGVYYVMCKSFSLELFILSFACSLYTNTILYTHMLMDFDADKSSHKTTLCLLLKNKTNALNFILVFYIFAWVIISYLGFSTHNYLLLLGLLTVPMVIDLYKNLKIYNYDKTHLPQLKFWHYPIDNWENISKTKDAPFYFRFIYSRNIMTFFMFLTCIAIIFS